MLVSSFQNAHQHLHVTNLLLTGMKEWSPTPDATLKRMTSTRTREFSTSKSLEFTGLQQSQNAQKSLEMKGVFQAFIHRNVQLPKWSPSDGRYHPKNVQQQFRLPRTLLGGNGRKGWDVW